MRYINQTGAAPILVLLAIVGVVAFLVLASGAPFKDKVLTSIYPKDESLAATALPSCWPDTVPAGALPGQPKPIWCYTDYDNAPSTHIEGPNSWLDEFNHGLSLSECCEGYKVFDRDDLPSRYDDNVFKTKHWRHANHWMVDVAPRDQAPNNCTAPNFSGPCGDGGAYMRPDKAFKWEDFGDGKGKRLIVEFDAAIDVEAYHNTGASAFVEMDINTAPVPTGDRQGMFGTPYGYNTFLGHWSFGCRMGPEFTIICALYNPTQRNSGTDDPDAENGRVFENQAGIGGGAYEWGGGPFTNDIDPATGLSLDKVARGCKNTDPDTNCRDRIRAELSKNSIIMYRNGVKYYELSNLPPAKQFPDALINADNYIYFSSWTGRVTSDTVRFHWDRIAINPKDAQGRLLPPSAPADFCPGQPGNLCQPGTTPVPSSTTAASAQPSVIPTPTPSPAASPSGKPGDIDGNNRVDIFDYNTLLTNFGRNGTNLPGDFDRNGRVDIFDLNTLLSNFGQ